METKSKERPLGCWIALVLVVAIIASLGILQLTFQRKFLAPGEAAVHEDISFLALRVKKWSQIGSAFPSEPGRAFYVIDIRVDNRSKTASFNLDPAAMRVFGNHENILAFSRPAQQAFENAFGGRKPFTTLAAGESATYSLVFEGPEGMQRIALRYAFGGPVEEFLDSAILGKYQVLFVPE